MILTTSMPNILKYPNMYADDTVLYVASEKLSDIEAILTEDVDKINYLADWLEVNQLVIHLKKNKTESMVFGTAKRLSINCNWC